MKSLVFFSSKGGVGKTTLTFNIAHMLARKGHRVVVLDYDPECALSALFLGEEGLFDVWEKEEPGVEGATTARTVAGCLAPVRLGQGRILEPKLVEVAPGLWLLPGQLDLIRFEQTLAEEWPRLRAPDGTRAVEVMTALARLSTMAAEQVSADVVMMDVAPGLRVLNRAALLACDAVVFPLVTNFFSLQGLATVGPILREWRQDWVEICQHHLGGGAQQILPVHPIQPIGYVVQQFMGRLDHRIHASWAERIPTAFHEHILGEVTSSPPLTLKKDGLCLATLTNVWSLASLAQLARKPIFDLKQADGASSGHQQVIARCRLEFEALADRLLERLGQLPEARPLTQ
ncbi:ParA family protein [Corallococcus sicarius]|uniref:ParA family protein n=1 Tax=Corallococcus sicarius TaxID=2316726 RepID=A0A3A8NFX4_9BACT|nr:ParA family protein [Corallococcus sicarius]RKH42270.1 ParA family protein [Corallococcus sicarius]